MRHTLPPQLQLGELNVSAIEFDAYSRDDIPQLLRGLQHLYDHKEDRDVVLDLLRENILEEVDAICTRAIIIASGQLLFDGTPEELLAKSGSGRMDDVFRDITTDFYAEKGEVAQS